MAQDKRSTVLHSLAKATKSPAAFRLAVDVYKDGLEQRYLEFHRELVSILGSAAYAEAAWKQYRKPSRKPKAKKK